MFGDILSDGASINRLGLGIFPQPRQPAARECVEPVHGATPDVLVKTKPIRWRRSVGGDVISLRIDMPEAAEC